MLPGETQARIDAAMGAVWNRPPGPGVGRVHDLLDGAEHYVKHLVEATPHRLDGLRVVVDCANGAASDVAPAAYTAAGADVVAIHAAPDGLNINDGCGSTHLGSLRTAVVEHRAHVGIAHDGDADRCLAVTADGAEIDGDHILAILALALREQGALVDDTLVATVMSNLGLKLAMRDAGIRMVETRVGDRYVLEALRAGRYTLGGEQSGHVVMPAYATTGDGVLTGLHLLARVAASGRTLAELASVVTKLPQVLLNVPVADRRYAADADPARVRHRARGHRPVRGAGGPEDRHAVRAARPAGRRASGGAGPGGTPPGPAPALLPVDRARPRRADRGGRPAGRQRPGRDPAPERFPARQRRGCVMSG